VFELLVDDELALVLAEPRHAEELVELQRRNHQLLARWQPWAATVPTVEESRAYIQSVADAYAAGTELQTWIRLRGGDQLVGSVGMRFNAARQSANVGYWLDAAHSGRGIATRSVRTLVEAAIRHRGVHRMEVQTSVDNAPSRALAERLGFHLEGVMREALPFADRRDDLALYAVLATEWGR
jgi:ribosomal-protein-serine acetyltransferase